MDEPIQQPQPVEAEAPLSTTHEIPAPPPGHLDVLGPDGEVVSIPKEQMDIAVNSGFREATPQEVAAHFHKLDYGTPGQIAKTAVEGVAQGVAGPFATALETKVLGVNPADIRGREEENPGTAIGSQALGFVAPAIVSAGATALGKAGVEGAAAIAPALAKLAGASEAGLLEKAGAAVAEHGAINNPVTKDVARGAFEGMLYQGGEELNKKFKEDPQATADSAVAHLGMATVMGGLFGGAVGKLLRKAGAEMPAPGTPEPGPFVSQLEKQALDDGHFATIVAHEPSIKGPEKKSIIAGLKEQKPNAKYIIAAAKENDLPLLEGMTSNSKWVQKAEDALVNGAPTVSGIKRQQMYQDAYDKANNLLDITIGEGSKQSKAELGNSLKTQLSDKIEQEYAPIKQLYDTIKESQEIIALPRSAGEGLIKDLEDIRELKLAPRSPEGQMVRRVIDDAENLKTVDDIAAYRNTIGVSPTAPPNEKRVAAILKDKLMKMEEKYIDHAAEGMGSAVPLKEARVAARNSYKGFITDVQELAKQLGKGRVYGAQDALHFIENLTPEQVANRTFAKNNSEFLSFFKSKFPDQFKLMQDYQRQAMREAATKDGVFSPQRFATAMSKLEPEIRAALFSKEELKKINQVETYLHSFPKAFNPSGTSHQSAFREFFNHPTGAIMANARDFGIEKFIKAAGSTPEAHAAVSLAQSTIKGEKVMAKAIKSLFSDVKDTLPNAVVPIAANREKLMRQVEQYKTDPNKIVAMNDNNPVPEYAQAFSASASRVMNYLASIDPNNDPKAPLDKKFDMSPFQRAAYNRALDIAQNPLTIISRIHTRTMVPQDVAALRAMYPSAYQSIAQGMLEEVAGAKGAGKTIPYPTRLQLSLFLGQPLDSSMTPAGIQAAQVQSGKSPSEAMSQQGNKPPAASSTKGLAKMAQGAETPSQSRARARASH